MSRRRAPPRVPPPIKKRVEEEPLEEEPLEEEPLEEVEVQPKKKSTKMSKNKRAPPKLPTKGNVKKLNEGPQSLDRNVRNRRPPTLPKKGAVRVRKVKKKEKKDNPKGPKSLPTKNENVRNIQDEAPMSPEPQDDEESGLLFSIDSDDEDDIPEEYYNEFYEVDEGTKDKPKISLSEEGKVSKVRMSLNELSGHKTGRQYMCPRFEVEKFNPRTKMKLLQKQRIWEVNFCDKSFLNIRRKDFKAKKALQFQKLLRVKIAKISEREDDILILNFKNVHPFRLKCLNKQKLMQFYEVAKCALPGYVVWSPDLYRNQTGIVKIEFQGKFHIESNQAGKFVLEEKELINTSLSVSSPYERTSLFIGTWNLCGNVLPRNHKGIEKFILDGKDLFIICIQQAFKKTDYYVGYFKKYLKKKEVHIIQHGHVSGVLMMVFAKKDNITKRKISRLFDIIKVKVSDGDGAVIIRLNYNESPLCFVGCCLSSGEENIEARKKAVMTIYQAVENELKFMDFHHVFWLGNLNFRISLPVELVLNYIKKSRKELIEYDQLRVLQRNKIMFEEWKEGEVKFNPTYMCKNEKAFGGRAYYTKNSPSFTDRILFKSYPLMKCIVNKYTAVHECKQSFHSPVIGEYTIDTKRCHVSLFSPPTKKRKIIFKEIYCAGNCSTGIMKDPRLSFFANFFEKSNYRSSKISSYKATVNPKFETKVLPILEPVKSYMEFLKTEYVKIGLFDAVENNYVGFAIIPLKGACDNVGKDTKFELSLYRNMKKIGVLKGIVQLV